MLRRLRAPAATVGGLVTAGLIDRALTPSVRPLTTAAAAAGSVGSVRIYQYDVRRSACQAHFHAARWLTPHAPWRWQICPFCNKVKSLLDLYRVPYETLEVNPLRKTEIKFSADYRKVPIAMVGEEQVNDSPVIAQTLMDKFVDGGVLTRSELDQFASPAAMEWAKWADTKFAVLLFPNMTRTFSESYEAFGYLWSVPHFSMLDKLSNQYVGAFFMWMAQGKIKKKYSIEDERAALHEGVAHWLSDGVRDQPFAGGARPNYADVCVYGCLRAIERTSCHRELMADTAVGPWYERMAEAVQPGGACTLRQ